MPNVLIIGGTGFLGQALGLALLRTGNYTVFGTARSADKAKTLVDQEIIPVEGEVTDPEVLTKAIDDHHIDTVIDVSQAYEQAGTILHAVVEAAKTRAASLAREGAVGPKLGFIYTSGAWVHGSPGTTRVSDTWVPGTSAHPARPAAAVAGWRPAHEQAVLAAREVLDVAILRPATVYGRASWVLGTWFGPLLGGGGGGVDASAGLGQHVVPSVVQIPADAGAATGMVHVDDLAAAYVAAVDRLGALGAWPVFDVGAETLPVRALITAAAGILGVDAARIEYVGTMGNSFLEALSLVSNVDYSRARIVLGWTPRRKYVLQNLSVIVAAWKSAQG